MARKSCPIADSAYPELYLISMNFNAFENTIIPFIACNQAAKKNCYDSAHLLREFFS